MDPADTKELPREMSAADVAEETNGRLCTFYKEEPTELAYIDILANPKIRLDSVKRMTQIQNTS